MEWSDNNISTSRCLFRSSRPEMFLGKGVLKICNKFTGEHPCRSVISIKLLCNFIEITLRQRRSPVNLLHIFKAPFLKNTFGRLLQSMSTYVYCLFYLHSIQSIICFKLFLKDRLQISLLIISKFKQINQVLSSLKWENKS